MKKQLKILITLVLLVGIFENSYSMQRFAQFRKKIGNSQFFKRFKTKKQTAKRFYTENIAKTNPKRSKVKTIGIMAGIAAGGYGLYESFKDSIMDYWYGGRDWPTKEALSITGGWNQFPPDKKYEDPSIRMLAFSGYGSNKQIINKIWSEHSTISKEEAEKKLKWLLMSGQSRAVNEYITLYKNEPIEELLVELYKTELLKARKIDDYLSFSDIALKDIDRYKQKTTNKDWKPFILNGNLDGVFNVAINGIEKENFNKDAKQNYIAILNKKNLDGIAVESSVRSLVTSINIPEQKQQNVIMQILTLAQSTAAINTKLFPVLTMVPMLDQ